MKRTLLRGATSVALSAALVASFCVPAGAIEFTPPTTAASVDDNVIKCFAGRVARFNPLLLGGDLVSTSSINIGSNADNLAGVFGSELNDAYDPWIWNYAYNSTVSADKQAPATTATDVADGTSPTAEQYEMLLENRPDIIINQGAQDAGAASLASDNANIVAAISQFPENAGKEVASWGYNPTVQTGSVGTLYWQTQNVKTVAATMKQVCEATGKTTRYGDPTVIAGNFEKFVWGTYSYVLKQIDTKKVAKKKVAVLSGTSDDGATWSTPAVVTASKVGKPNRLVEYVRDYCDLPVNPESEKATTTSVSIADLAAADCDVIIATNNGEAVETALAGEGVSAANMPTIINTLPQTIVGIIMQSNENGFGIPYFASLIYGDEIGLNPVYTDAFWNENFLHVSNPTSLQTVTSYMLQDADINGLTTDLADYDASAVVAMIAEGCEYAVAQNAAGTPIMPHSSGQAFVPDMSTGLGSDTLATATITLPAASYTYTGSAIRPVPVVSVGNTTLTEGVDYTISYKNNVNVGTATVTLTATGLSTGARSVTFAITKAANKLTLAKASKSYKAKKKTGKLAKKKSFKIGAKAKTKVTYTLSAKAKKAGIKVSKAGKVTVKKGTKAGTYKIKVKAAASANYKASAAKTVKITIKAASPKVVKVISI